MSSVDIRNFMNKLQEQDNKLILKEHYDNATSAWFVEATNNMISQINAGKFPEEVINDIAREYCWKNGNTYEAFSFAKDVLVRRATELGIYFENVNGSSEDPLYSPNDLDTSVPVAAAPVLPDAGDAVADVDTDLNSGIVSTLGGDDTASYGSDFGSEFDEPAPEENPYQSAYDDFTKSSSPSLSLKPSMSESVIMEDNFLTKMVSIFNPEKGASLAADQDFKEIAKKVKVGILRNLGHDGGKNVTLKGIAKVLRNYKFDGQFIVDTTKNFVANYSKVSSALGRINFGKRPGATTGAKTSLTLDTVLSTEDLNAFAISIATDVMSEGGLDHVSRGNYRSSASGSANSTTATTASGATITDKDVLDYLMHLPPADLKTFITTLLAAHGSTSGGTTP